MLFFALAKGSLASFRLASAKDREQAGGDHTYAARFCAFRLLCADVRTSLTSLQLSFVLLSREASELSPGSRSLLPAASRTCNIALLGGLC
jgi:hypothetical protein